MFERSDLVETGLEPAEFRAGLRALAGRINRTRTRLSLAGVVLLDLVGFAALTGNFALVLVTVLKIPGRGT